MTGWLVLAGIALVVSYCGLIVLVQLFGEWAVNREAERTAAATFERDFVPEAADVAATERELGTATVVITADTSGFEEAIQRVQQTMAENEMCALLDDAREHVERLVFAAECAEWEDAE